MQNNTKPKRPTLLADKPSLETMSVSDYFYEFAEGGSLRAAIIEVVTRLNNADNNNKSSAGGLFYQSKVRMRDFVTDLGVPPRVTADFMLVMAQLGVARSHRGGKASKWEVCHSTFVEGFLTDGAVEWAVGKVLERHQRTAKIQRLATNLDRMKQYAEAMEAYLQNVPIVAAGGSQAQDVLEQLAELSAAHEELLASVSNHQQVVADLRANIHRLEEANANLELQVQSAQDPVSVAKAMVAKYLPK